MRTVERSCHCEPVVLRAANQNFNDCQWQSYLNVAHAGVALSKDSLRSQSVSQSLLLRGEGGSKSRMRSLSNSWVVPYPACHCEPVRRLVWQSVSFVPPWLPLRGSCHEVTERVNTPSPPLWGTSPYRERQVALIHPLRRAPSPWGKAGGDGLPHQSADWFAMTCDY